MKLEAQWWCCELNNTGKWINIPVGVLCSWHQDFALRVKRYHDNLSTLITELPTFKTSFGKGYLLAELYYCDCDCVWPRSCIDGLVLVYSSPRVVRFAKQFPARTLGGVTLFVEDDLRDDLLCGCCSRRWLFIYLLPVVAASYKLGSSTVSALCPRCARLCGKRCSQTTCPVLQPASGQR